MALTKLEYIRVQTVEHTLVHAASLLDIFLDESESEFYWGEQAKIDLKKALRSCKLLRERAK